MSVPKRQIAFELSDGSAAPFAENDHLEIVDEVRDGDLVWFEELRPGQVAIHNANGGAPDNVDLYRVEAGSEDHYRLNHLPDAPPDETLLSERAFLEELLERGDLPRRVCTRCGRPAEFVRHATLREKHRWLTLPISLCRRCVNSPALQNSQFGMFESLLVVSVVLLALALATGADRAVPGLALIGLTVLCLRMGVRIWRRNRLWSLLLRERAYRALLARWNDPRLQLEPRTQSLPPSETSRAHLIVLTSPEMRVHPREFGTFFATFNHCIDAFRTTCAAPRGFDLQIACALLPGKQLVTEVQMTPEGECASDALRELSRQLQALPCPNVIGPVAFARRLLVAGGSLQMQPEFRLPFAHRLKTRQTSDATDLDILLMSLIEGDEIHVSVERWTPAEYSEHIRLMPDNVAAHAGRAEVTADQGNLIDAMIDYRRAIQLSPRDPDLYAELAECQTRLEHWDEAEAELDRALEIEPDHVRALTYRALLRSHLDRQQEALADLDHAVRVAPQHVELYVHRGMIYRQLGENDRAFSEFHQAIFRRRDFAPAYLERARAFLEQGNIERAMDDLESAATHAPGSGQAFAVRASVHYQEGHYQRAVDDLQKALERQPQDPQFRLQLAEAYASQGKHVLAIETLTGIIEQHPELAVAWGMRGVSHLALDEYDETIEDCTQAIDSGLQLPQIYFTRAAAHQFSGAHELALPDLETALELDPQHAGARNSRGLIHLQDGDYEAAVDDFTAAIAQSPDWAIPYFHRGNAHAEMGQTREAIADYEAATRLMPGLAAAHTNRGIMRLQLHDESKALEDFDAAIKQDAGFAPAYFERAAQRLHQGDAHGALQDLNQVLTDDPNFTPAYYTRAQAWRACGDLQRAVADLDELIRRCPTLTAAYTARGAMWTEQGDLKRGAQDFQEAIQLDPERADEIINRQLLAESRYYQEQCDFESAVARASEIIARDAEYWAAYETRAAAHWYAQQFVEALEDYNLLIDRHPQLNAIYAYRGQVYAELGEFEEALTDLDRALSAEHDLLTDQSRGYALNGRGLALAGLGRHEDADRDFDAAIPLCPANAWLQYNLALVYRERGEDDAAALCFRLALRLDDPELTPLKRRRAEAFLETHPSQMPH